MTIHESAAEIAALLPVGPEPSEAAEEVVKKIIYELAARHPEAPKDWATRALYNAVSLGHDLSDAIEVAETIILTALMLRKWFKPLTPYGG